MASTNGAIDQAAPPKPVDESLWWDSFVALFDELDDVPLSSDLPDRLVEKLKNNRSWFLDSVSRFKPPNQASKLALDSPRISIGSRALVIELELKEVALRVSSCLCLDEVQSYVLVDRSSKIDKSLDDIQGRECLHPMLLQYCLERQCLLKCIRRLFVHVLYGGSRSHSTNTIRGEALQLVHGGLEGKLLCILQNLLSSASSEEKDYDFMVLWAEEILIEVNFVLDILFLAYYENLCTCRLEQWKSLCSNFKGILSGTFNIQKLAVSAEANMSVFHAKSRLLLILIEALDLDNLLWMVHDEKPFREQSSAFSLSDVQEIDTIVSGFSTSLVEAGPLILSWAIFLCLLLSLPDSKDRSVLMEIDHIAYVRQAFDLAPFNYLFEILQDETLRDSDGPVSGFLSILRTLISAFIASYELSHQLEDNTLNLILETLCHIYHGEEMLSMQFWDRESFVDGPIRSLLFMLQSEFPYHSVQLLRLLSALCEGKWSAECVFNFLDKMNGISSLFEISDGSCPVNTSDIIETHHQLHIPGVEGLIIPSGCRGYVLKFIDANHALVRWECPYSGLLLLLLGLTKEHHSKNCEEFLASLNVIHHMVSFNTAVCFSLMYLDNSFPIEAAQRRGYTENNLRVNVVQIICNLVSNLTQDVSNASVVSICIKILAVMLKCAPSHVVDVATRTDIFGTENTGSPSDAWLFCGSYSRMLLGDCDDSNARFSLVMSVLDFTMQLVETGADNMVSALAIFSLQYVFVNHVHWKYKFKYARWNVTLKVLEVMKCCIKTIKVPRKLGCIIRDILLNDSSIHNILCQILCVSAEALENLYVNRHIELKEVEGLQLAVHSAYDVVYYLLADIAEDAFSTLPAFVQTMLSSAVKPIPVVGTAISLVSFYRNSAIQVSSARVLTMLCYITSKIQPHAFENVNVHADSMQLRPLSATFCHVLEEELDGNEDLLIAMVNLLLIAAKFQPALLVSITLPNGELDAVPKSVENVQKQLVVASVTRCLSAKKSCILELIVNYVKRSVNFLNSTPHLLLRIVSLLKTLWEGGSQYFHITEEIRRSEMFWKHLTSSISKVEAGNFLSVKDMDNDEILCVGYRYHCQGTVLEIMAHELFLQSKLSGHDDPEEKTSDTRTRQVDRFSLATSNPATPNPNNIFSAWFADGTIDHLIKSYSSCAYSKSTILHSKRVVCLCIVQLMAKLSIGDTGSLSISLVEKMHTLSNKLTAHPAFSALLLQYSSRGYSEGKELFTLILNDLSVHLQGELEGREITPGHFKELSNYLLEQTIFECDKLKYEWDIWPLEDPVFIYDIERLHAEFRLDFWVSSEWKAAKEVAEMMFQHMHKANSMMLFAHAKQSALKALMTVLSIYEGNAIKSKSASLDKGIPAPLIESSIQYMSDCLQETIDLLVPTLNPPKDVLKFIVTQEELLLILSRIFSIRHSQSTDGRQCLPVFVQLVKMSGLGIKFLVNIRPSTTILIKAVRLLLMLLVSSLKFCYSKTHVRDRADSELNIVAEASLTCIGLLPVLCKCVQNTEYYILSVTSMDLMLKGFLAPNTWLPIIQKHLCMQLIVQKVQHKDPLVFSRVTLNFLLTVAHVKGGAKILHATKSFSFLKILFNSLLDDGSSANNLIGSGHSTIINKDEDILIWRLGFAVITSMISSLNEDVSCTDVIDSVILYFSDKAYLLSGFLCALNFAVDNHTKTRALTSKIKTSLAALRQAEATLMLICVLAKYQASWSKGMKEIDAELRETSIHLLAFISKGVHRSGDSSFRAASLFCPPLLIEEVNINRRRSLFNSRHGWFSKSALFLDQTMFYGAPSKGLSLMIKDQACEYADSVLQTQFSDAVAIQIYKIASLLLKFLCVQAKAAAKRAEEVEFIDFACFPELPTPEILHGIQDQAISIVAEFTEAKRSDSFCAETEGLCLLLLQVVEKSLYLEFCVMQCCGIRPVLGRVEEFSKEIKVLMKVAEKHVILRAALRSLRQIIALVYPGLFLSDSLS